MIILLSYHNVDILCFYLSFCIGRCLFKSMQKASLSQTDNRVTGECQKKVGIQY